jgi:hypothetical protein
MGILALGADERVKDVRCTDDALIVDLMDGRTISVPLAWYPRLANATAEERAEWRISAGDMASTGPPLTKISAPRACCAERPRRSRGFRPDRVRNKSTGRKTRGTSFRRQTAR